MLYVRVGDRQIRLTGAFDEKGTTGTAGVVAAIAAFVPIAGFFATGTSARIPLGAPVKGFVDEDVPVVGAAASASPAAIVAMPVSAPAPGARSLGATITPAVATTASKSEGH